MACVYNVWFKCDECDITAKINNDKLEQYKLFSQTMEGKIGAFRT